MCGLNEGLRRKRKAFFESLPKTEKSFREEETSTPEEGDRKDSKVRGR